MENQQPDTSPARRSGDTAASDGKHTHVLPALPYAYNALEPYIDAQTMTLHHDKHHAGYVDKLNATLAEYPTLRDRPATWLILNAARLPDEIRTQVCHNAGGHVNHSMFWRGMAPEGALDLINEPANRLTDSISRDFGSLDQFKAAFEDAGAKLFGSGWVWLVRTRDNREKLAIVTTPGHENPLTEGHFPILVNDVWEHAYYLEYQNRRPEYLKRWWAVVNWREASLRFEYSGMETDRRTQDDTEKTTYPPGLVPLRKATPPWPFPLPAQH
jgi:Fe-Mn family superoxide dismutase